MKQSIFFKSLLISLFVFGLKISHSFAEISVNQLPTGAKIVSGDITINQQDGKLTINQASNQGIIEWKTFNVGSNAS
ncbi:MAG: hypothetical protein ACO3H5_07365, partial [Candidatus Nanopelagicales bacterium]